jgi:hypothetical protein
LRILADGHVSKTRAQPGHLDDAQGLVAHVTERLQGMPQTTPIISGGMNALRLPAFFENLLAVVPWICGARSAAL